MICSIVLFLVWMSLSAGSTVMPKHEGCFSTSFVQQYAFYYKFNHSLSIQQCLAACNNRLTRYMGLEVDESSPDYNYVFCGNDLAEVSPKTSNVQCIPCKENSSFSCGRNSSMSVYLLRDLTPLSLLIATNQGVELLSDNMTTLKVVHYSTSLYKSLDYIYTEDMIVSAISTSFLRSFYNPLTVRFSQHYEFYSQVDPSPSLCIDYITRQLYYGYKSNKVLYRGTTHGAYNESRVLSGRTISYPEQISIDPYNRSLVFLENPTNAINILLWDGTFYEIHLNHLHVKKINALSMDIQEMLLYAILTFNGDSSTYLVSLDYGASRMRMLFSGPQLENAKLLEVFQNHAVWLRDISGVSNVFQCTLTPRCQLENVTVYRSNQTIFDFTIYHPEKQTPGRKRLCANLTCSHGCQLFSTFTARCSCPPGEEWNPDYSYCVQVPSIKTVGTENYTSSYVSTMYPADYTTVKEVQVSKYRNFTMPLTQTVATQSYTSSYLSTMDPVDPTTKDFTTVIPDVKLSKNTDESGFSLREIQLVFGICVLVMLLMLIIISAVSFGLYSKVHLIVQQHSNDAMELREPKQIENCYMEVPLRNA